MNRVLRYIGAAGASFGFNALFQIFIPFYFLKQFTVDDIAGWMLATSAFTILTSLDFGLLQYTHFKSKRININFDNRTINKIKYIYFLNGLMLFAFCWVSFLCILIATLMYPDHFMLAICIILGFANRLFFGMLRSINLLDIGYIINIFPSAFVILVSLTVSLETVSGFIKIYLLGFGISNLMFILVLIFLRYPMRITIRLLRIERVISQSSKYWFLNICQVSNQFLPLLVLGAIYKSNELVLFGTIRTIVSMPLSAALVINNALQPYVTDLLVDDNATRDKAVRKWKIIYFTVIGFLFLIVLPFSETFYKTWLNSALEFSYVILALVSIRTIILIYVFTEQNINVGLGQPLAAINIEIVVLGGLLLGALLSQYYTFSVEQFVFIFMITPGFFIVLQYIWRKK